MNIKINLPGITQEDFEYAFFALEDCKKSAAKEYGFLYPFFDPGGAYGEQWWELDSSLALCGYKWYDQKFCETTLLNFIESQCENGRIKLWGNDILPSTPIHPKQRTNVSALPKLFDVAYHVVQRSMDANLKVAVYDMFQKYLTWWFMDRQDKETGLISSLFEETFIPYLGYAGEYAATDTNVEVAVGCYYTACLAEQLGDMDKKEYYLEKKEEIATAINQYLWSEELGAYFPYDLKNKTIVKCLMASTFCPLRLNIASAERKERLLILLQNDEHFNWNGYALTSVSKVDPCFTTTKGRYQGNASWSGNVWSLINEMTVRGLLDCKENKLAAELALKTIRVFNHNCAEFANPYDGSGHGVKLYAWTASQYLEMIFEIIFGLRYDAGSNTLIVAPNLPEEFLEKNIFLKGVPLPSGGTVDVTINNGKVECHLTSAFVTIKLQ